MTEEDRIEKINLLAAKILEEILLQLEDGKMTGDDLLAVTYGHLIAAALMGYRPENLCNDASAAAKKIIDMVDETENGTG